MQTIFVLLLNESVKTPIKKEISSSKSTLPSAFLPIYSKYKVSSSVHSPPAAALAAFASSSEMNPS